MTRRRLIDTIFYNITTGTRNNLIFPTIKVCSGSDLGHFNLGNIRGSGIAIFVKILVYYKNGRESNFTVFITTVCGVKENLSIKHYEAERFSKTIARITGIPTKCSIHSTHDITIAIRFSICCLFRHNACLIVSVLRNHAVITIDNLNVFIVKVSFHNEKYLTTRSIIVIQNDFGFGNTRSDVPIFF